MDHLNNELDTHFDAGCSQNLIEFVQLLHVPFEDHLSTIRPENFSRLQVPCLNSDCLVSN